MTNETPLFEVRCGFQFSKYLYLRSFIWIKDGPTGITSWPFSKLKIYSDRIDLVPFPAIKSLSIPLKNIVSIKSNFFRTIVTLQDSRLPMYLFLISFSYFLPTRLYSQLKSISEKYNLGIKFE